MSGCSLHSTTRKSLHSGSKITPSMSYVTVRGEGGEVERRSGSKTAKGLSEHVPNNLKYVSSVLFSTHSMSLNTDFYTTLYFVNKRNNKTPAMQAHALTHTR
jgi:hypothetical protein